MYFNRVGLALTAGVALAGATRAQSISFKDVLPTDTLMFFSAPDLDTTVAEFQHTALAKMWRETQMQDFLKEALQLGTKKWGELMGQVKQMHDGGGFPLSAEEVQKLRVSSLTAALTSVEIKVGQFGPEPKIGVLLHADFGASAASWGKLVRFGIEALMQQPRNKFERTSGKIGDVELITLVPPRTEMSLNIAFVGNGIVIGLGKDQVQKAVEALQARKPILAKSPDYIATTGHLDNAGAEVEGYFHFGKLLDAVMGMLKVAEREAPNWPQQLDLAGIERAVTALGLRSVRTLGLASKYKGEKALTRSFMLSPEADRKGWCAGKQVDVDLGFLKWVPKDVAQVSASSLDFPVVYQGLVQALRAYNPDVADQLLARLGKLEEQVGMTLKDDLFGAFGDQMAYWSMGFSGLGAAPEGAAVIKVKDAKRLVETLQKVAKMTDGLIEFPSSERRGVTTWRLEVNANRVPQAAAMALATLQPSFAFKQGYMVIALSAGDVRRTLKRMDRTGEDQDDVRSNKQFAAYLSEIKQTGSLNSLSWTDWRSTFEALYGAASTGLALLANQETLPVNMTLLPEVETLSRHLFSSMSKSTVLKDGFLSTSVSPIGTEVVVGAVLLAAGGSAFAFGQRAAMAPRAMRVRAVRPAPARPKKGEEAGKEAGDQGGKGSGDKGSGDKGSGTNRK
ncbi:MAG: hypothetical protein KDC87_15075 [Planctomycetes bacterium]|nr:hypothetical protein [Planctomycetota bacterium]MCB9870301.1 hypothetical protein [Planctomycetota bacterium]